MYSQCVNIFSVSYVYLCDDCTCLMMNQCWENLTWSSVVCEYVNDVVLLYGDVIWCEHDSYCVWMTWLYGD